MDLVFAVVFLLCIALSIWKRLWMALGVLGGVIVLSNLLYWSLESPGGAGLTSVLGIFLLFPIVVYLDLSAREKKERAKTIRRSRRRTGRA